MKIKELQEILIHFTDPKYDDFDVVLWDYSNQRIIEWPEGMYALSKPEKSLTFPVKVEPVDGVTIDERLKRMMEKVKNDTKPTEEDKPVEEDDEAKDVNYDARMFVRLLDIIKVWAGYDDRYGTTGDSEIDDDYYEVVDWLKSKESAIISNLKSKEE
jgi:hypothetical protein